MKIEQLRKKTPAELNKHATSLRAKVAEIHRQKFSEEGKSVHKLSDIRKELARTLTIAKQKEEA